MDSAMTRFAIRAAYGASQLPRVAWYIGHGFVMGRLAERMRQQERQRTRPRAHSDTPVPDRARLYRDMAAGGCIGQSLGRQVPEWLDGLILSATWLKPSRDMARLSGAPRRAGRKSLCLCSDGDVTRLSAGLARSRLECLRGGARQCAE